MHGHIGKIWATDDGGIGFLHSLHISEDDFLLMMNDFLVNHKNRKEICKILVPLCVKEDLKDEAKALLDRINAAVGEQLPKQSADCGLCCGPTEDCHCSPGDNDCRAPKGKAGDS